MEWGEKRALLNPGVSGVLLRIINEWTFREVEVVLLLRSTGTGGQGGKILEGGM